ncbi:MAG: M4 family metallopeptidase [Chitinophagales bacterium]
MRKYICIFCGLISSALLFAQSPQPNELFQSSFGQYISPDTRQDWISFRKNVPFSGRDLFTQVPEILGLQAEDEMELFRENTDMAGNKHYKFVQYYKGVRVEGMEYYTHERNGILHLANGDFIQGLNLSVSATVPYEDAILKALLAVPAEKYMWQDEQKEADFKKKKDDPNATLYPRPELLIVKKDPDAAALSQNYILAWRVAVFADQPYDAQYVYIDANNGQIIRKRSLIVHCNPGTAHTTWYGEQPVNTNYEYDVCIAGDPDWLYFSWDDCSGATNIKSYVAADLGDHMLCDADNDWDNFNVTNMVMTSLWCTKKAYNYYHYTHGHDSFDGSGGLIDLFNNRIYYNDEGDPYCTNANYTNIIDNLNFGSGNDCIMGTTDDYNTIDIVGHEYTHGVIEYAHFDALDYSDESGALNESFADIFGEIVEEYAIGGDTLTWLVAQDRGAIRSFVNPNAYGDPDTYKGVNWAPLGGDDNGGVHTNSSVQNHMFYLLCEGGSGYSDNGIQYNVQGIGWQHARDIAWQAMIEYLDGSDGYIIARNAWIQAATDLFGSCSQEVISVGQAFQAVGVTAYTAYDLTSVCGTFTGFSYQDATYGIENSNLLFGAFFTDCNTTINAGAIVYFASGFYVQLNPGFTATAGSNFTAYIAPCEISEYDPDDVRYADADLPVVHSVQKDLPGWKLFPNPADLQVQIQLELNAPAQVNIQIIDLSGRAVMDAVSAQITENGTYMIPVSTGTLASGVYLCSVLLNGKQSAQTFLVQH